MSPRGKARVGIYVFGRRAIWPCGSCRDSLRMSSIRNRDYARHMCFAIRRQHLVRLRPPAQGPTIQELVKILLHHFFDMLAISNCHFVVTSWKLRVRSVYLYGLGNDADNVSDWSNLFLYWLEEVMLIWVPLIYLPSFYFSKVIFFLFLAF